MLDSPDTVPAYAPSRNIARGAYRKIASFKRMGVEEDMDIGKSAAGYEFYAPFTVSLEKKVVHSRAEAKSERLSRPESAYSLGAPTVRTRARIPHDSPSSL